MYYPGFCAKYGQTKVKNTAFFAPIGVDLAFQIATGHYPAVTPFIAMVAGGIGAIVGVYSHDLGNYFASKRSMGITKGGQFVRKFQAAAYGIPVAAAFAFNLLANPNPVIGEPQAIQSSHMITSDENNHRSFQPQPQISPRLS